MHTLRGTVNLKHLMFMLAVKSKALEANGESEALEI